MTMAILNDSVCDRAMLTDEWCQTANAKFDAAGNRPVHGVSFKDTQTEVDIDAGSSIDIMLADNADCGRFL